MFLHKFKKLILWCLVIFAFSSIPSAKISNFNALDFVVRKFLHISEFLILTLISYSTFKNLKKAVVFSVLYAISDEIHQRFTPGRGPSPVDVLIDCIGIILGTLIIWKKLLLKTPKKIQKLLS